MVQFDKIRLSGFKSFVDPTELVIEPGMTGIVGPNGCGKSNLVEALKWVMGETSAKQMRGSEMEDVIFATQGNWAAASDPIAELAKSLRIAGMGDKEVKACLADDSVSNAVIADYRGGETLGVNSTPTLFINGQQYRGTRTAEDLDAAFAKLTQ